MPFSKPAPKAHKPVAWKYGDPSSGPADAQRQSVEPALAGLKVFVVEDSPDSRALIRRMLVVCGAEVEVACDGAEAVAKAKATMFDVILMDMQMPVLDGYAATAELRRLGYKLPIVALTAQALREDRERSLASGCDEHLTKPIGLRTLVAAVARAAAAGRLKASAAEGAPAPCHSPVEPERS